MPSGVRSRIECFYAFLAVILCLLEVKRGMVLFYFDVTFGLMLLSGHIRRVPRRSKFHSGIGNTAKIVPLTFLRLAKALDVTEIGKCN